MYGALGRGVSLGDAVVAAKREGIRRGSPPAAWAGVVLLGDAQVQPRAGEPSTVIPLGVAGAALAFAGLGAGRRWKRSHRRVRENQLGRAF